MTLEIIDTPISFDLHGFSGAALNKDYAGTAFKLMDKMWRIVKSNDLKNKGLNIWVYEPEEMVFAGVELEETPGLATGLEQKHLTLQKYASYKHIGPYHQLKQAGKEMTAELKHRGFETTFPYVEIYGHWTSDETKLVTELLMCLK